MDLEKRVEKLEEHRSAMADRLTRVEVKADGQGRELKELKSEDNKLWAEFSSEKNISAKRSDFEGISVGLQAKANKTDHESLRADVNVLKERMAQWFTRPAVTVITAMSTIIGILLTVIALLLRS